jgi:magnesium transporter
LLAAKAIGFFENTLSENLILASFIPLIMYMGGSTLSQTEAFFIRDLAVCHNLNFSKYFTRQFFITALMALFLSILTFFLNIFLIGDQRVGCVISFALFLVLCMTTITSLAIPYLFFKLKKDPADGSGPIATIFQDALGVIVYFVIASMLL